MRISDITMEKLLMRSGVATAEQVDVLKKEGLNLKLSLQEVALNNKVIDDTTLAKAFSEYTKIPYIELDPATIPKDVYSKIPEHIAMQYKAILFKVDESGINHLAMEDPDDVLAIDFIQKQIGSKTKVYVCPTSNIKEALGLYHGDVGAEIESIVDNENGPSADLAENQLNVGEIDENNSTDNNSPIAKTVNLILEYAIRNHASDVHIEPRETFIQIRCRVDGILKEVNRLPKKSLGAIVSRIKILSNLKIDEHRIPQDGRFKIKVENKQFALRVSSLPVSEGEKIVIRILDESNQAMSLESLGYWGKSLSAIKQAMAEPNGMILVTGPTGSGKSTSLFSILTELNKSTVNISTIEDPIEYKIPGINQTQTNPKAGMTFASGLRALLRQDPNIIMVGEIRDSETAELGIQAALTGHLVLSTLHTNNAATCLPRLLDMEVEPFLIASTVKIVIGQRLIRRLRQETRISYQPTTEEIINIKKIFGIKSDNDFKVIHELEKQAAAAGIGGDTPIGSTENGINTLWHASNNNNDSDNDGFKGRFGLYEVLESTPNVQRMIMSNATSAQIQTQAISEGMITMQIDGLVKALRGETTIEEVVRVTKE